jgi:hypothetical protein
LLISIEGANKAMEVLQYNEIAEKLLPRFQHIHPKAGQIVIWSSLIAHKFVQKPTTKFRTDLYPAFSFVTK